jgi:amino acid transporter
MADEESTGGDTGLRRDIGLIPLMFSSEGAIIGSGWLFGALYASQAAGPAALIGWILGGFVVILLALVFAELGSMYPIGGSTVRVPHFAFGSIIGFSWGWIAWLGAVAIAPIEVEAVLQYAANYLKSLKLVSATTAGGSAVILTGRGLVVAALFMLLFTAINLLGVSWFAKSNAVLVAFKIATPTLAAVVLLIVAFHASNLSSASPGGFAPFGIHGILAAISGAGIFFALFGFEQAATLAGESTNPKRNVPLAVIGSVLLGTAIYIALQVAFSAALPQHAIAKGWDKVNFAGAAGPYAGLATILGLGWLAFILYVDAGISPAGTGLVYTATGSRLLYGLSRNGYIPRLFEKTNSRGVPVWSIVAGFIVGMFMFLPFRGWAALVVVITSAYALFYAVGPLALGALRHQEPDRERPYQLPAGNVLAPVAFIAANYVVYFAGWDTNWKLFLAVVVGLLIFGLSYITKSSDERPRLDWRGCLWMWPYLGGLALLSYFGSFGDNKFHEPWDLIAVAAFSLGIYYFAVSVRLDPELVHEYVEAEGVEGDKKEAASP